MLKNNKILLVLSCLACVAEADVKASKSSKSVKVSKKANHKEHSKHTNYGPDAFTTRASKDLPADDKIKADDMKFKLTFKGNVMVGNNKLNTKTATATYPGYNGNTDRNIKATTTSDHDENHPGVLAMPKFYFGGRLVEKNYNLGLVLKAQGTGFGSRDNRIDSSIVGTTNRDNIRLSIEESEIGLGTEKGLRFELGNLYSAASQVLPGDKQYYRGSDKGIVGSVNDYYQMVQTSTGKTDENNISHPNGNMLGNGTYLAGDDYKQFKAAVWTPVMEKGKVAARLGLSSSLNTDAPEGMYVAAGGYVDYKFSEEKRIRFAAGGGTGTKENFAYITPSGQLFGLSYHSKAFDLGFTLTHNNTVFARKEAYKNYDNGANRTVLEAADLNRVEIDNNNYTYNEDHTKNAFGFGLKGRIGLVNDIDLTFGAIYTNRPTGWTLENSDNKAISEEFMAVSLGVNFPIPELPFRFNAAVSYVEAENKAWLAESVVSNINGNKSPDANIEYKNTGMFMLSLGINYYPAA